ncbi:MAG: energy-coupling factor transporter transmembrane component T family protein [Lachnospiraceae bacterium]
MTGIQTQNSLHPFIAIAGSIAMLITGLALARSPYFMVLLLAYALLLLGFGYWDILWKVLLVFITVGAIIGTITFLFTSDATRILQMMGRIVVMGLAAIPLVTMPPIRLTRCLAQVHCPRTITLGILIVSRFFPLMQRECQQIRQAMRTRGASVAWYRPSCLYRAFLIPLLTRLVNISDTLTLSLETRGFELGGLPATIYEPVALRSRDKLFAGILVLLLGGMVIAG